MASRSRCATAREGRVQHRGDAQQSRHGRAPRPFEREQPSETQQQRLLPAPLCPISPMLSPARSPNDTSRTASTLTGDAGGAAALEPISKVDLGIEVGTICTDVVGDEVGGVVIVDP